MSTILGAFLAAIMPPAWRLSSGVASVSVYSERRAGFARNGAAYRPQIDDFAAGPAGSVADRLPAAAGRADRSSNGRCRSYRHASGGRGHPAADGTRPAALGA